MMKRTLFILTALLLLCLDCFSQSAEQIVRNYVSVLNNFLLSPDNSSKRTAFEKSAIISGCYFQDGIYIKYKGNVNAEDNYRASDYAGIIANAIHANQRYSYAKVEIARSLQSEKSGDTYVVTAYLQYTLGIEMRTVTQFHIKNGKIIALTNDFMKTKDWNIDNNPDPPQPQSVPFSITSCTVSNWSLDAQTEYMPFNSGNTHVLWSNVTFSVQRAGSYDILCKFITPITTYSETKTVQLLSGNQKLYLYGCGNDTPGNHPAGSYRFEFYYNGTLLYTHRFNVSSALSHNEYSDSHEYIDLGLPSGTLWATCNVGANNPWESGDYFSWGEIYTKSNYDWSTYKFANGTYNKLTKYCNSRSYGDHGFTDGLTILESSDDVARQKWGNYWCMPTPAQFQELKDKCTWIWTTQNGIKGYEVKGLNGKQIFLPAVGCFSANKLGKIDVGIEGYYWTNVLDWMSPFRASNFIISEHSVYQSSAHRSGGMSIRPIRVSNF